MEYNVQHWADTRSIERISCLIRKTVTLRFWDPFGGLEATYAVHLRLFILGSFRLIGKLVGDFLLVEIDFFSHGCFRFVTIHAFNGQTDGRIDGFTIANTALHTMQRGNNRTARSLSQTSYNLSRPGSVTLDRSINSIHCILLLSKLRPVC